MYTQYYRLLIASALVLAMVSVNVVSAATASQDVIEARQTQIETTTASSPYLRSDLKSQCTMALRCSPVPSRKLPMKELAERSKDLMP